MLYTVRIQHGTYVTNVKVHAEDDDEAMAKARTRAKRDGFFSLPMAYESVQIVGEPRAEDENL